VTRRHHRNTCPSTADRHVSVDAPQDPASHSPSPPEEVGEEDDGVPPPDSVSRRHRPGLLRPLTRSGCRRGRCAGW
jgi:hypothetical protein